MKATGIVRRIDDLGRVVIFSMLDLAKRMGTDYYILTDNGCSTMHIHNGSKKMHKGPKALE